jgi:hypothetical protein
MWVLLGMGECQKILAPGAGQLPVMVTAMLL